MFENKVFSGIYATRFIASWINEGGELSTSRGRRDFKGWLKSLGILSDDDIKYIINLVRNGKLELEQSAKKYMTFFGKED